MCIKTNKEQDNNIAYNDPACVVWREKYTNKQTIYPIIETITPFKKQFLGNKNNFSWELPK